MIWKKGNHWRNIKRDINRRDELIPLERSRRVIYLDRRGREGHMPVYSLILLAMGVLCLLYCLGIGLFMGFGTLFFLIWGVLGGILLAAGWFLADRARRERIPGWLKRLAGGGAAAGLLLFIVIEVLILGQFGAKAPKGADYCIVLGAQMKEDGPSDVLRRRLDAALGYLRENPDTIAIVSGAQGADEPMSEAQGMYEYLTAAGIEQERILLEEQSGNTCENLSCSSRLIDKESSSVVVVTNNFHVFRATGIARKTGFKEVYGLAATSYPGMLPNNLLREFLGVIKDFVAGNL